MYNTLRLKESGLLQIALDRTVCNSEHRLSGPLGKTTDYIVPESMFLFIFIAGSKLGRATAAGAFCKDFSLELHFRLNNDCSVIT